MNLICSGTGGQGVLTLGLIVANIATDEGKYVTWVPSYGSEMRGGSSNCTVRVSDQPIMTPYMKKPDLMAVLDKMAFQAQAKNLANADTVIIDSSIVHEEDIKINGTPRIIKIDAKGIAERYGAKRGANLVIAGAIMAHAGFADKETAVKGMIHFFAKKGKKMDESSVACFAAGYEISFA